MKQAIQYDSMLADQCRFLLMEMNIGILNHPMRQIIETVSHQFPNLYNKVIAGDEYAYNNFIIKGISYAYDQHVNYYAEKSEQLRLEKTQYVPPKEQLLFWEQLGHRAWIQATEFPLNNNFTLREAIQYLPGFQGNFICYGIKPSISATTCVPTHPWIWRNTFKNNLYQDALPCLNHQQGWHPSSHTFFLQGHTGEAISFMPELTKDQTNALNKKIDALNLPFFCKLLPVELEYHIHLNAIETSSITYYQSPLNIIKQDQVVIPFQAMCHQVFKNKHHQIFNQAKVITKQFGSTWDKVYQKSINYYHDNPLIIIEQGNVTGLILRHILDTQHTF